MKLTKKSSIIKHVASLNELAIMAEDDPDESLHHYVTLSRNMSTDLASYYSLRILVTQANV